MLQVDFKQHTDLYRRLQRSLMQLVNYSWTQLIDYLIVNLLAFLLIQVPFELPYEG